MDGGRAYHESGAPVIPVISCKAVGHFLGPMERPATRRAVSSRSRPHASRKGVGPHRNREGKP
jgi:hypothetical protein